MILREMMQEHDNIKEQMQSVLLKAELEKRELTHEESEKWDRMDADVERLRKNIERRQRMEALDKDLVKTPGNDPVAAAAARQMADP